MPYNPPGDNITVSLSGDDGDVLRGYWEQLSGTGTVSVPLEKQMWGRRIRRLYRQIRHFLAGEYRSAPRADSKLCPVLPKRDSFPAVSRQNRVCDRRYILFDKTSCKSDGEMQ